MTKYEVLVAIHVLMAVVWVGGNVMMQILAFRTMKARDSRQLIALGRNIGWIDSRVFMPVSIVLLTFGIWAAKDGKFDFGSPWISLGLLGFLVSLLLGMGVVAPQSVKLVKTVEAEGDDSATAAAIVRRLVTVTRYETLLLLVVVVAMVGKWGS